MTSTQSHIQDQLQRKHEELQQLIVQQQEELRRVSEQLLMARYGLLPSIVNVAVPFNPIGSAPSRTSQSHANITSTSVNPSEHQSILQIDNGATNANNPLNHCDLAIEQIDSHGDIQSNNDGIISYMELQSTSNAANLEPSMEEHSMASLLEHQRLQSQERRARDPTWDLQSNQQLVHMQHPPQSGNVQVPNLPQNSHLQIETANVQQLQRDSSGRHMPSMAIPSTAPVNANELEIPPYQIVEGPTPNLFPSANDDNL